MTAERFFLFNFAFPIYCFFMELDAPKRILPTRAYNRWQPRHAAAHRSRHHQLEMIRPA